MSKADLLLKKAASFEKLALYSDRKAFLQAVAQDAVEKMYYPSVEPPAGVPPVPPDPGSPMFPTSGMGTGMNAPAVREQGKPAPSFKPIDPTYQTLLGVEPDGKWGPETQAALEAYKAKIKQPGIADGTALGLLLSNKA